MSCAKNAVVRVVNLQYGCGTYPLAFTFTHNTCQCDRKPHILTATTDFGSFTTDRGATTPR